MNLKHPNKILIVDDDLALQPLWKNAVKQYFKGAQVHWAVSSEEAKEIFLDAEKSDSPIRLVITDIFLAGSETGFDLVDFVRGVNASVPVVLVSVAEEKLIKESVPAENKNITVISKPLSMAKCESVIHRAIEVA